eukprot:g4442.t1
MRRDSEHPLALFRILSRILTETFGPTWEKSLQLEAEPLGSGCMAQVHRGCLHGPLEGQRPNKDAAPEQPRNVAVKARCAFIW